MTTRCTFLVSSEAHAKIETLANTYHCRSHAAVFDVAATTLFGVEEEGKLLVYADAKRAYSIPFLAMKERLLEAGVLALQEKIPEGYRLYTLLPDESAHTHLLKLQERFELSSLHEVFALALLFLIDVEEKRKQGIRLGYYFKEKGSFAAIKFLNDATEREAQAEADALLERLRKKS